jgi:hypothetical protein
MANKTAKPKGFVLVTILNPQPGNKHHENDSLGKQIRVAIENVETNRPFEEVNGKILV